MENKGSIDKPLAYLIKKKRQKIQINIRIQKGDQIKMTEECEIIRRKYEDQLNINELENYVKKMIFLEKK